MMMDAAADKDFKRLKETLKKRRDELFQLRKKLKDYWNELQEKEVELEEMAVKRKMSSGLEKLEERHKQEIEAIDTALRRMEWGRYGLCSSCGKPISLRRLEAVPWTPYCIHCAKQQQGESVEESGPAAPESASLPADYQGLSDEGLKTAVYEQLQNDGRVELEELKISAHNGVIHIEGTLPSETSHQILHQILQDIMGLHEIEENIRIDRVPWQRRRRKPREDLRKTDDEKLLQGEDVNEEVFDSCKSGTPVIPPDKFVPEK